MFWIIISVYVLGILIMLVLGGWYMKDTSNGQNMDEALIIVIALLWPFAIPSFIIMALFLYIIKLGKRI